MTCSPKNWRSFNNTQSTMLLELFGYSHSILFVCTTVLCQFLISLAAESSRSRAESVHLLNGERVERVGFLVSGDFLKQLDAFRALLETRSSLNYASKSKFDFVQAASFQRNWGGPLLRVQKLMCLRPRK